MHFGLFNSRCENKKVKKLRTLFIENGIRRARTFKLSQRQSVHNVQ